MGRKSRRKKLNQTSTIDKKEKVQATGLALFLVEVVRWGAYAALFAPLVVSSNFLFPFVVTKTVFFWIFAEIIFAAWVLLAISNKRFRPKWNALTVSFLVFIFVALLTSFTGVNVERSFWSTVERMAGTINWIHLAIFFFALSSTLKSEKEWKKIFSASIIASLLVSLIFLFERIGVSIIGFDTKGGSTIGNSSFMSAYLIFNMFFGIWLIARNRDFTQKVLYGTAVFILALTIFISTAYGVLMSMVGGFFLLFIAWMFFARPVKLSRFFAVSFLAMGIIAGGLITYATFTQDARVTDRLPSFFSQQETIQARKVVWGIAVEAVKEKPILGWGPENFNAPFAKYFNPCLALDECGNEVWFDRTHNIILDHLVNSGIVGLLSYLAVLLSALFIVWRKVFKASGHLSRAESGDLSRAKSRDWVFPTIITATIISYLAQNMLVFDMLNTYLMFALTLSAAAAFASRDAEEHGGAGPPRPTSGLVEAGEDTSSSDKGKVNSPPPFAVFAVLAFLLYFLFSFGFQSWEAAHLGLKTVRGNKSANEILQIYRKSLSVSPVGNRQITEFFTTQIMNVVASDDSAPDEFVEEIIRIMEGTVEKNPLDYRERIVLGNLYNIARHRNEEYIVRGEEVLKKAIDLSPNNQQSYFALVENYYFRGMGKEALEMGQKGVSLEPRFGKAHWFLSLAYEAAGEEELAKEALAKAEELGYKNR